MQGIHTDGVSIDVIFVVGGVGGRSLLGKGHAVDRNACDVRSSWTHVFRSDFSYSKVHAYLPSPPGSASEGKASGIGSTKRAAPDCSTPSSAVERRRRVDDT